MKLISNSTQMLTLDNSKISKLNNFPRVKFEEQIRRTVSYLQSI